MAFGFDFFKDFGDCAFFVNDKRSAGNAHVFPAVHGFFHPYTVILTYFLILVGQEGEG